MYMICIVILTFLVFITCTFNTLTGEHMTPEYEKVNPFKRVPAMNDDGFLLSERYVILAV